ncbi:MAG: hypothetical protein GY950_04295 [bacterium]|nr:hypothetical protein [bacterium]
MKRKKFVKKLELNKTTITDLTVGDLEKVKGGVGPSFTCLWNENGCVIIPQSFPFNPCL